MNTLFTTLKEGEHYLENCDIKDAKIDAWYLLSYTLNIDKTYYLMNQNDYIDETKYLEYKDLIKFRGSNIPLQYIIGYEEFMGLKIKVNKNVLIPRQETEILVEMILKICKGKTVLDLCTGSGCIIISIAKYGNILKAVASDISKAALEIAKENAINNNVNIDFIESDLFDNINEKFDIIVSNPPYIPTEDINSLMKEVKNHEPRLALDGSDDGLEFYRQIVSNIENYLNKGGHIYFEIGYNQGIHVVNMLKDIGISEVKIIKDLSGLDRIVHGIYM